MSHTTDEILRNIIYNSHILKNINYTDQPMF